MPFLSYVSSLRIPVSWLLVPPPIQGKLHLTGSQCHSAIKTPATSVYAHMQMYMGMQRGQRVSVESPGAEAEASDLEPEVQLVVSHPSWVLGTNSSPLEGAAGESPH